MLPPLWLHALVFLSVMISHTWLDAANTGTVPASLPFYPPPGHQIGDALSDAPATTMEYAMRQEAEQIIRVSQRIASCMAK